MKNAFKIIAVSLVLGRFLLSPQQLQEFEDIRKRMYGEAAGYVTGAHESASTILGKQNADGSFKDFGSGRCNNWRNCMNYRLLHMAQLYKGECRNSELGDKGNVNLKKAYYKAMRYYIDNKPNSTGGGWKKEQINTPRYVAYTLILMYDDFMADIQNTREYPGLDVTYNKILNYIYEDGWPKPQNDDYMELNLGANLALRMYGLTAWAVCTDRPSAMDSVLQLWETSFEVDYGTGKQGASTKYFFGMNPDGSWHQHNYDAGQYYWMNYGAEWMDFFTKYAEYTENTDYELKEKDWLVFEIGAVNSYKWSFFKGKGLYNVGGRYALKPGDGQGWLSGSKHEKIIKEMHDAGGSLIKHPDKVLEASQQVGGKKPLIGDKFLWTSDLLVHSRKDNYIGVSMLSERNMGPELGNGRKNLGFYMGQGSYWLSTTGDEFEKSKIGWSMTAIPGTTAEQKINGMPTNSSTKRGYLRGNSSYAGAATDSRNSAGAFIDDRFHDYVTLTAKKGYFLFDDVAVFLGNSIKQSNQSPEGPTYTTLNQTLWRSTLKYKVNGQSGSLNPGSGGSFTPQAFLPMDDNPTKTWQGIDRPCWFHQDNIGYVIIPNDPVDIDLYAKKRTGDYKWLDEESSGRGSANIFQLSINHGTKINNDNYEYHVFMNVSADQMDNLMANLKTVTHQNDGKAMVVEHKDRKITMAAIFDPSDPITTSSGLEIQSDQEAIMVIRETADSVIIHLNDPNQDAGTINLTLNQVLSGSGASSSGNTTSIAANVNIRFASVDQVEGPEEVIRLSRSAPMPQPTAEIMASIDSGLAPLEVIFEGTMSSSPNGEITEYTWQVGDTTYTEGAFMHNFDEKGKYYVTLTVKDEASQIAKDTVEITVLAEPCRPDNSWQNADIGDVGVPGNACQTVSSGTFQVSGSGWDVWGKGDAFHYTYIPISGDFDISGRVDKIQDINEWSKGGLMIRESIEENAANAFAYFTPAGVWSFQYRAEHAGRTASSHGDAGEIKLPYYLKLERRGNTIKGFRSDDGRTWTQMDEHDIPMADDVFVGIATTSHERDQLGFVLIEDIQIDNIDNHFPVELLEFRAEPEAEDQHVHLYWTTGSELNNNYFEIERSRDGDNFEVLERVFSQGNATSAQHYQLYDNFPYSGTSYYRLKQVDFDGTTTLFNIVEVDMTAGSLSEAYELNIHPIPSSSQEDLYVVYTFPDVDARFRVVSTAGDVILDKFVPSGPDEKHMTIPGGTLQPGYLIVTISNKNHVESRKIVVQE